MENQKPKLVPIIFTEISALSESSSPAFTNKILGKLQGNFITSGMPLIANGFQFLAARNQQFHPFLYHPDGQPEEKFQRLSDETLITPDDFYDLRDRHLVMQDFWRVYSEEIGIPERSFYQADVSQAMTTPVIAKLCGYPAYDAFELKVSKNPRIKKLAEGLDPDDTVHPFFPNYPSKCSAHEKAVVLKKAIEDIPAYVQLTNWSRRFDIQDVILI